MGEDTSAATLLTFPPSLDCELARFLLAHYGVPVVEEPNALLFSPWVTFWRAGTPAFPVLLGHGFQLTSARAVADHFDPLCAPERRLIPSGAARNSVEKDWKYFYDLSFATAIFAYHHLLPNKRIMVGPLSAGAPAFEARAVDQAYPVFAGALRLLLAITPARAASSLVKIRAVLDEVEKRLADGRRYLCGERLSLSDLVFSVAVSPLVVPDEYGGALPSRTDMPPALAGVIDETRRRPAGEFSMRVYRDHRRGESVRRGADMQGVSIQEGR
jgi:glutathione S-transferase